MARVQAGGLGFNVAVDGDAGAPWIVLSNSLGSNLSMWDDQIPLLMRKYRVLRYDHRGHGGTDIPPGPYSWDQLTGDVIALMDTMDIARADWMGLSMGSMTGMGLAIHHGDRFGRMVLADGRADAPPPFQEMWDGRIGAVEAGGVEAIADATLGLWLTEGWRKANPERTAALRTMMVATDTAGYLACCHGLKQLDYLKDLGKVMAPTLCITGAQDLGAAPEVVKAIAQAIPGACYAEVPDAAHIANINNPEAFNAAIAEYLEIG